MIKRELGAKRDVLPDVLKGFGIFLVVLGHCIQGSYNGADLDSSAYFDDALYQFIYSFHMPLFMVISGYYAWNSIHRADTVQKRWKMITKKCIYLITPIVAWKFFDFLYWYATGAYIYRGMGLLLIEFLTGVLANFWFLWAVLYSFILVCLMHYKFHDCIWLYVLVFIAMFFTPDGLGLMACKFVLPYYLIGFYVNKNKVFLQDKMFALGNENRTKWFAFLASGIAFGVLVYFYDADSFVYLTGYKLIGKAYSRSCRSICTDFLWGCAALVFGVFSGEFYCGIAGGGNMVSDCLPILAAGGWESMLWLVFRHNFLSFGWRRMENRFMG